MTAELADGEETQVKGSGSSIYTLKNSGGVYSCTCPAWRNQSLGLIRTCKHLRAFRGDDAEIARLGSSANLTGRPPKPPKPPKAPGDNTPDDDDDEGPPVLLAHKWENDVDLTGWWLSEKLDGVRAYWDGERFISRLGNEFFAPKWFTAALPKSPLDGELFGGRKQFQRTVGIVKRQDASDLWKELQYVVFDAPSHGGVFEERVAFIEATLTTLDVKWLVAHKHELCNGTEHLRAELARVEGLGGEGLMVRQPRSRYEAGRSNTLLKVKSFHDTEARVLGHVAGLGRHKGRLGALLVELPDGTQFNVGTGFSDVERENPPKVGSIITFRYQELSNSGTPRFPSYIGERIDGTFHSNATIRRVEGVTPKKSAASAPPPPAVVKRGNMPTRRFEMTDGDTRYFWEVESNGSKQKVRFGTFEEKEKLFEDDDEARENTEKKIAEKLGKGFQEVGGGAAAAPAKKKSPFDDEEDDAPAPAAVKKAPAPSAPAASSGGKSSKSGEAGARYFEFIEGSSAKFWEIRVEGTTFYTRYGKIGTDGQMTQKDFDSDEKTQSEANKLIAEKTKKGYAEK
ncbi:MAG: DNA ligase [Archangium sp.]|nr:DNA ligase [Archangium sp.]MDP3572054.1 DNA ligase [Archangium sp.]